MSANTKFPDNSAGRGVPASLPQQGPPRVIIQWQKALLWHSLAFLTVIVLTWCEEAFYFLHELLTQVEREPNFMDAAITTAVIVLVWGASGFGIYRLVARLNYLERFLHVCAWCSKVNQGGRWVTFEAHFTSKDGNAVTHGICPECSQKALAEV